MIATVLLTTTLLLESISAANMQLYLKPDDPLWNTYLTYNEAVKLHRAERYEEAEALYRDVISQKKDLWEAHNNLGNVLNSMNRESEALQVYHYGMEQTKSDENLKEIHASFLNNIGHQKLLKAGNSFQKLREAKKYFVMATTSDPNQVDARYNAGNIEAKLGYIDRAMNVFFEILKTHPNHISSWLEIGNLYFKKNNYEMAEQYHRKAAYGLDLTAYKNKEERVRCLVNLGQTLRSWGRADEAEKAFQEAVHVIPNSPLALILLSVARKEICVWEQLTERRHEVRSTVEKQIRVDKEFPALLPYDALMMPYDPIWRLEVATAHSKQWSELKKTPTSRIRHRGDPLVVGYFSYDFRKHAMGFLTRGFLHHHNRDRVRPIAYSYGPNDGSKQRERLMRAVDGVKYWRDIYNATGELTGKLVRQDGVHIAIDLMAHTTGSRQEVMATQSAPISAQYLGYPSTMGATYVNLVIVDKVVAPPEHRSHFSEQLVILPQTYQSNDYPLDSAIQCPISSVKSTNVHDLDVRVKLLLSSSQVSSSSSHESNVKDDMFHFVSFNKITKLEPKAFRTFARILRRVPRSTLTILSPKYESVKRRLEMELYAQGVEKSRIVFAPMIPRDEHLRRVAQSADLFLDTFVYNAHTTATDALWSGTPVLTLSGPDFAARVATSHVKQMGLETLSASSLREFEDLAVRIAKSPKLLRGLKRRLCKNMWSSALFDTILTTRRLEQAYEAMWDVYTHDRESKDDVAGTRHIVVAAGTGSRSQKIRLSEVLDSIERNMQEGREVVAQNILLRLKHTLSL